MVLSIAYGEEIFLSATVAIRRDLTKFLVFDIRTKAHSHSNKFVHMKITDGWII